VDDSAVRSRRRRSPMRRPRPPAWRWPGATARRCWNSGQASGI